MQIIKNVDNQFYYLELGEDQFSLDMEKAYNDMQIKKIDSKIVWNDIVLFAFYYDTYQIVRVNFEIEIIAPKLVDKLIAQAFEEANLPSTNNTDIISIEI